MIAKLPEFQLHLSHDNSTKIVACCRERKKSGLNVEDLRDQLEGLFKHVTALLASINKYASCSF